MKKKHPVAADYLKIVEWSDEDQCFIGSAPPIIGPCCHGDDEVKVYQELCGIVEEWVGIYRQEGRPLPAPTAGKDYSGKFVLRVGAAMHKRLTLGALKAGVSLNSYCKGLLDGMVGVRTAG